MACLRRQFSTPSKLTNHAKKQTKNRPCAGKIVRAQDFCAPCAGKIVRAQDFCAPCAEKIVRAQDFCAPCAEKSSVRKIFAHRARGKSLVRVSLAFNLFLLHIFFYSNEVLVHVFESARSRLIDRVVTRFFQFVRNRCCCGTTAFVVIET